jgi:hypothetical protein
MKLIITTAETDESQTGKISVEQTYSLDATKDFEEHIEGMDDDGIIEAAMDLDFVNISETEIVSSIHNAVRGWSTIDMSIDDVHISLSGPGAWEIKTVEEARNKVKNLKVQVVAEFSYCLDYTHKENLEKAVLGAVTIANKDLKKDAES